ncbi:MFS transporter [Nonomuraea sp. NPDC050540]|uniref:MFS transporter n=1 Tax=Nonomuraea sp. NPDC050540 TaxID=3364367 RepID=UPI0037B545E2
MSSPVLTAKVSGGWTARLALAQLGLMMGWFTLIQIVLPQHMVVVDDANKEASLAVVFAVGAAVSMVSNVAFGALSDRTRGRFGRRRPWIMFGALTGAAALALLGTQQTVLGMTIGWSLVQLTFNAAYASTVAVVPDRVPEWQRGRVLAVAGAAQAAGPLLGGLVVALVVTGVLPSYLAMALLLLATVLPFALATGEGPVPETAKARFDWRTLWVSPRRHPDFAWAWVTRFLLNLSISMGTGYLLYYLRDAIGYERLFPGHGVDEGVLILLAVSTVAGIAPTLLSGWLSDKIGKRRPIVSVAALLTASAGVLLAFTTSWPTVIVAAVILGAGSGAFLAVDQALLTQVLPTDLDRGKDLGVLNLASAGPQVLAPVLAAPLVTQLGGYPALYTVTAAVGVAGALLVWKIRGVP